MARSSAGETVMTRAAASSASAIRRTESAAATTDSAANTDVCKLLTNAEIEAVQREHVEQTRPNARSSGGLLIADCLFRTTTPSKSVSVELVMRDPKANSALTPQEFWRKQFG